MRAWIAVSAVTVAVALVCQVHNAFLHLPLDDFDAPGHAVNVFALYGGELPDPNVWSGFHPVLHHALGAALWYVLPETIELHVALRLVSIAAAFLTISIVWRSLCRLMPVADASVVAAALYCVPGVMASTGMLGNESLCALLVTAAMVRLVDLGRHGSAGTGGAALTGLLVGLAAASKATGLIALGVAILAYAVVLRRRPRGALKALTVLIAIPALLAGPHYVRLAQAGDGSLASMFFAGAPVDGDLRAVAELQPPGERHLSDYLMVPPETLTHPDARTPELHGSVPGLLYASAWAGAQSPYLRRAELPEDESRGVRSVKSLLAVLGLPATLLLALGLVQVARRRELLERAAYPLLLLALLVVSFLRYTWIYPILSTVKSSFLLSGILPLGIVLGSGLAFLGGATRTVARSTLLVIAAVQVGATWHGWWSDVPHTAPHVVRNRHGVPPSARAEVESPASTVQSYFEDRVRDPIRSLELLTAGFHETHGLRVSRIFAGRRIVTMGPPSQSTEIERAKLAWLAYLSMHWVVEKLSAQEVTILPPEIAGGRASVRAWVRGPQMPAFVQTFELVRGDSERVWRIERIEQEQVQDSTLHEARAAAPSMDKEEALVELAASG